MKNFVIIAILALFCSSCEETQPLIYDGEQTLVYFDSNASTLEVNINDVGSVDILIGASAISSVDRTINIYLDEEATNTNLQNFNLPSTVTIPANEYFATLTVTGVDFDLETSTELIVIGFEGEFEGGVLSDEQHTISIKQVCPLGAPFIGEYLLEQLTAINPDDGVQVFEDQILDVVSEGGNARSFSAVYLEGLGIGQPPSKVVFNLICNDVIVNPGIGTGLLCTQGQPVITLGPGTTPATYDSEDDSVFVINMTEYVTDGGCGAAPYQVTFRLTKQ